MPHTFHELRIRHADRRDAASLADIKRRVEDELYSSFGTEEEHRRSLLEFCSPGYVAGLIDDPHTTVLVAERGGVPVGLAAVTEGRACDLLNAVYATIQRQGVGLLLVRAAAELAIAHGQTELCCETFAANSPAIAFFRSLGFEPYGERPSDSYGSQMLICMRAPTVRISARAKALPARDRRSAAPTSSG